MQGIEWPGPHLGTRPRDPTALLLSMILTTPTPLHELDGRTEAHQSAL